VATISFSTLGTYFFSTTILFGFLENFEKIPDQENYPFFNYSSTFLAYS